MPRLSSLNWRANQLRAAHVIDPDWGGVAALLIAFVTVLAGAIVIILGIRKLP